MIRQRIVTLIAFGMVVLLYFANSVEAAADDPYTFLEQGTTLIDSNLFTQMEDYTPYEQGVVNMDDFEMVLDNNNYEMYLNPDGLAVRFVDKDTGFVWASDVINIDDYELSGSWRRRILSSIYIDYIDEENRPQGTSLLHRRSSENPEVDYTISGNTIHFEVDFEEEEFYLEYSIELFEDGFDVFMDTEKVDEYGVNKITKVTFFEFLGSSYEDDIPGYMFVPSGNGALIRFTESSPVNSTYVARYYSQDKYREISSNDTMLNYPLYGSVYGVNENGFLAIIEEGSEYTQYNYKPPTFQAEFHLASAIFLLRENYIQNVSGGNSVTIYEKEMKDYNPHVSFHFLKDDQANYVGMANVFKDYLIDESILTTRTSGESSIHIDVLAKEYEQGLLFKNNYIMTSTDALLEINEDLVQNGVDNIVYSMRGYNKGGYSDRSFDNYAFDRQVGRASDLRDLDVLFYYDPIVHYTDSSVIPRDTLQLINLTPAQVGIQRGDYFQYYVDIDAFAEEFPKAMDVLNDYGGVLLDGISNNINTKLGMSRKDIIALYDELVPEPMPQIRPNYYMWDNTSMYFQSVLYHNRSRFFTDSVPFEQIILSGYMPMYSQYLNFSPNINIDLLRLIDFGVYPAFLITDQPSHLLSKTMSSELYATYYSNLNNYIYATYDKISDAFMYTAGEEIVGREVIAQGVVKVTYSNDVIIYVNYSNDDFTTSDQVTIEALDYKVER